MANLTNPIIYESFLIEATSYEDINIIGQGRFGVMTKVRARNSSRDSPPEFYAKRTLITTPGADDSQKKFMREIEAYILTKRHPAICKFYGFTIGQPQSFIVEYLSNGSLQNLIDNHTKMPINAQYDTIRAKTIFGIAAALVHLRNHSLFHRYLTPQNILFDDNWEPRLVDFAFAKSEINENISQTRVASTDNVYTAYQAPEMLDDSNQYDGRVDLFAFGMLMFHICTGTRPFGTFSPYKVMKEILSGKRPSIPDFIEPKLSNMIQDLWSQDPNDRPEFLDILKGLIDSDEPLFPSTDMNEYRQYREKILHSTYFTPEDEEILQAPAITEEDQAVFKAAEDELRKSQTAANYLKLARMHEKGIGTDRDLGQAFDFYLEAAKQNQPEALFKVANFYCLGLQDVIDPDPVRYVEFLCKSADRKYPPAICDYAFQLLIGTSHIPRDEAKAEEMLKLMANPPHNFAEAQYRLAGLYEQKGNGRQAVQYYQKAADQGIQAAESDYGLMLLTGSAGIDKNEAEGINVLKRAADRGSPMANYNLGLIYELAKFSQATNYPLAYQYYQKAHSLGNPQATVKVAKALFRGAIRTHPVEKNETEAARLFERIALAQSDPEGIYTWGVFLQKGLAGTPKDVARAELFYKIAADKGFSEAMYTLYTLYESGINGIRKPDLAMEYLNRAVAANNKRAIQAKSELDS